MKKSSLNMNVVKDQSDAWRAAMKALDTHDDDTLANRHDLIGALRERNGLDRRTGEPRRSGVRDRRVSMLTGSSVAEWVSREIDFHAAHRKARLAHQQAADDGLGTIAKLAYAMIGFALGFAAYVLAQWWMR